MVDDRPLTEDDVKTILERDVDDDDKKKLMEELNRATSGEDDIIPNNKVDESAQYGDTLTNEELPLRIDEGKPATEVEVAMISCKNPKVMAFGDQRPRGEVDGVLPLTYERILGEQRADEKVQKIIRKISAKTGHNKLKEKFSMQAGLLYRNPHGNLGTPKEYLTKRLVIETMALIHTYYGHVGVHSLMTRFKMSYTGKDLEKCARLITRGCFTCQSVRPPTGRDVLPGHVPLGAGWGTVWVMDHIQMTPALVSGRNMKYFLNIVDLTTRFAMGRPVSTMKGSETIRLVKDLISIVGKVHTIRTDGGPGLGGSTEFLAFARDWGITVKTGVPNRPQAHAQAEVSNLIVKLGLLSHSKAYGLPWPSVSWLNNSAINHIPRKYNIVDPESGEERFVEATPHQLVYGLDAPLVNPSSRHNSRDAYQVQMKVVEGIKKYADKVNDKRQKEDKPTLHRPDFSVQFFPM